MIQFGGLLAGFALYTLMTWMPIWRMASAQSAEETFRYFVVVIMLVFSVFMASGGRIHFSLKRFAPAFVAGCIISIGYSKDSMLLMLAGGAIFAFTWVFFGE